MQACFWFFERLRLRGAGGSLRYCFRCLGDSCCFSGPRLLDLSHVLPLYLPLLFPSSVPHWLLGRGQGGASGGGFAPCKGTRKGQGALLRLHASGGTWKHHETSGASERIGEDLTGSGRIWEDLKRICEDLERIWDDLRGSLTESDLERIWGGSERI